MSSKKFSIALKLKSKNYDAVLVLGSGILEGLTGNPNYMNPVPSLPTLSQHLQTLKECIVNWGPQGNRGSDQDLLNLREARKQVCLDVSRLAGHVSGRTPNDVLKWTEARFPIKSAGHKIGVLQAVRNLRQFIARDIKEGTLKIKWDKPDGTADIDIHFYIVMRSATPEFKDAKEVAVVTRTSFTDKNPGTGYHYYWVQPMHSGILGVLSDMCMAWARPVA